MHSAVAALLLASVCCLPVWAKLTLLAPDPSTAPLITVPTQDFFQWKPAGGYFLRTGPAVTVRGVASNATDVATRAVTNGKAKGSCLAAKIPPNPARVASGDITSVHNTTIMMADWGRFVDCGVRTLTELANIALDFGTGLADAGYPLSATLVVMLNTRYPGVPGNPAYEPYLARSAVIPDGLPPAGLDVVIVTNMDQKAVTQARRQVRAAGGSGGSGTVVTVEEEPGPWNAVFLSIPYQLTVYALFALNILGVLYALYNIVQLIRAGDFVFGLRNVIIVLGILGLVLLSSSLLLRTFTYATKMLESISTFLISIAFHLLLYLWSVFLMQVRHNKSVYYFRGLIVFGACVVVLTFLSSIIVFNIAPTDGTRRLARVLGYLLPITQLIIGIAFLGYAVKFLRRRETVKISANTYKALTRLGQVAVIAFVAYFAVAVTNLDLVAAAIVNPGSLAAVCLLRQVSACVRGLTLLTVLGVKTAKKSTNVHGTSFSATASSHGVTSSMAGKAAFD